jgi:hypothetical protein
LRGKETHPLKNIREQVREFNQSTRKTGITGQVADIIYEVIRCKVDKMKGAYERTQVMMR